VTPSVALRCSLCPAVLSAAATAEEIRAAGAPPLPGPPAVAGSDARPSLPAPPAPGGACPCCGVGVLSRVAAAASSATAVAAPSVPVLPPGPVGGDADAIVAGAQSSVQGSAAAAQSGSGAEPEAAE
jgi:hypothetical protein